MYKVRFTKAFKKSYKLMEKRGFDIKLLDDYKILEIARTGITGLSRGK